MGIMGCGFRVEHLEEPGTKRLVRELLCVAPSLGHKVAGLMKKKLVCGVDFKAVWEQSPDYNNRITLSRDLDQIGVPRTVLNWEKTVLDRMTLEKSVGIFNNWLLNTDAGRIKYKDWFLNKENYPVDDELAGNHHMGGHENA